MYDFEKHLNKDEVILYKGRPVAGKGEKNISGFLIVIIFTILVKLLMLLFIKGDINKFLEYLIAWLVITFFEVIGIWGIVYNGF